MNISMLGSARAASGNLNGLAELLRESVVEVRSGDSGSGTGIIWGGAGLVVTNAHCIRRGAPLQAGADGKWREAHALAYHPQHDLALLAAPSVSGPLLELRDPDTLRAGELVFAHGHPLGIRDALAMGVLHAVTRDRSKSARWDRRRRTPGAGKFGRPARRCRRQTGWHQQHGGQRSRSRGARLAGTAIRGESAGAARRLIAGRDDDAHRRRRAVGEIARVARCRVALQPGFRAGWRGCQQCGGSAISGRGAVRTSARRRARCWCGRRQR